MIFKLTRSFTFTMVSCSDQSVWKCWRKNNEYDLRFVLNEEGGGGRCEAKPGVKESEGLSVWYQNVGNISASCNKHFTNNCNMNIISYTPMHEHYIGDPWTLYCICILSQFMIFWRSCPMHCYEYVITTMTT